MLLTLFKLIRIKLIFIVKNIYFSHFWLIIIFLFNVQIQKIFIRLFHFNLLIRDNTRLLLNIINETFVIFFHLIWALFQVLPIIGDSFWNILSSYFLSLEKNLGVLLPIVQFSVCPSVLFEYAKNISDCVVFDPMQLAYFFQF